MVALRESTDILLQYLLILVGEKLLFRPGRNPVSRMPRV